MLWGELLAVGAEARNLGREALSVGKVWGRVVLEGCLGLREAP